MKECVRHTDDALGDAWSCTSAFVCIGVFNRRLSVFTTFMQHLALTIYCMQVFSTILSVSTFVMMLFVLCGVLEVGEYRFPSGLVPVLNKCWKAETGVGLRRGRSGKAYFLRSKATMK